MEKHLQPAWMQTATCFNALKSDTDNGCNLTKGLRQRRYAYSTSCDNFELDCMSYSPYQAAVSKSRSCKSTPAPGGRSMRVDSLPMKQDSPPLVKVSSSLHSDAEAPSSMNQSPEVADSSWILRTLHQFTFSSSLLDPYTYHGYESAGHRYLYAPPPEITGFVDEGFTQIHPDQMESKVTLLEKEELCKTPLCAAESKLRESKEPLVETIQNRGEPVGWSRKKKEDSLGFLH